MRRRLTVLLATATVLLVGSGIATAGGGGLAEATCHARAEGQDLVMRDSCFEGIAHTLTSGRTITVTNDGQLPHTITAVDGSFDSGLVPAGGTYEVTIEEGGTVPIYCTLHGTADGQGMAGLLVVRAGDVASAEAASAAAPTTATWPWVVAGLLLLAAGATIARRRRTLLRSVDR